MNDELPEDNIWNLQKENARLKKTLDEAGAENARIRRIAESRDVNMVDMSRQIAQLQNVNASLTDHLLDERTRHDKTKRHVEDLRRRLLGGDISCSAEPRNPDAVLEILATRVELRRRILSGDIPRISHARP